jgi:hypothetical protein
MATISNDGEDAARRRTAEADYRKKLLNHKELESRVRSSPSLPPLLLTLLQIISLITLIKDLI